MSETIPSVDDLTCNESEQVIDHEFIAPGTMLQNARMQTALSTEDIAGRLCLRVSVIEAIEANDFESIPSPVFMKGYLRSYAKLLGLDGDTVIAAFSELDIKPKKTERLLWQKRVPIEKKEKPFKLLTWLLAIGALALAGVWWWQSHMSQQRKVNDPVVGFANKLTSNKIKDFDLSKLQVPNTKQKSKPTKKVIG